MALPKNGLTELFSFEGRLNRLDYFLRSLAYLAFGVFHDHINIQLNDHEFTITPDDMTRFDIDLGPIHHSFSTDVAHLSNDYLAVALIIFGLIVGIGLLWFLVASQVKRLHDMNQSGWLVMLNFVPPAAFILWLVCIFGKGHKGSNIYGEDPLAGKTY